MKFFHVNLFQETNSGLAAKKPLLYVIIKHSMVECEGYLLGFRLQRLALEGTHAKI